VIADWITSWILFLEAITLVAARGKHRGLGRGVVNDWHRRARDAGWNDRAPGFKELTWEFYARHFHDPDMRRWFDRIRARAA
jgi:hypothetical protein